MKAEITLTELDQPHIASFEDLLLEIGVGQLDHVVATAGFRFRRAASTLATQSLVSQLLGLLQTGIDQTAGRTLSIEVGRTGFGGAEQFDGREALDLVLSCQ